MSNHWAKDYVAYCADNGIIAGRGNGMFDPNAPITGYEAAKILLSAMGENGLTGAGWLEKTQALTKDRGLDAGITADLNQPITRDDAARLLYNAFFASDGSSVLPKLTLAKPGTYPTLSIGKNEKLVSPDGGITLTVNGVGKPLESGKTYYNATISVTKKNVVRYSNSLIYNFRQAIYAGPNGYDPEKSVSAIVTTGTVGPTSAQNVTIRSEEERFNGIYVGGGTYYVNGADITLIGNGGNDFAGYGSAIMASGKDATLIVDNSKIYTDGAVRTGATVDKGGKLIVKNSTISANDGTLPADYVETIEPGKMMEVPWMLGLTGNNRATNLLGTDSTAAYINSTVSAEGWGILSSDNCTRGNIVAINSKLRITGPSGYGSVIIGGATGGYYGTEINVPDYGAIIMGGDAIYGDSDAQTVSALNEKLGLGLSAAELSALVHKATVVNSGRFGIMQTGAGSITISGATQFNCGETVFLIKGVPSVINVDGSKGAKLKSNSGVILQLMDTDDPGMGGEYREPTGDVAKDELHDIYSIDEKDVAVTFTAMTLEGNLFNSTRGGRTAPSMFSDGDNSKNLGLTLDGSTLKGVITSSTAVHKVPVINKQNFIELGRVTNTPAPAVNNGTVVKLLNKSTWVVTGTCYLTGLTISADSTITTPAGQKLTMTVNGVTTEITPGRTYTGNIVLTVN